MLRNYDNIDDLVIKWNVSYYLNSVVKKFAKIGDYAPDNYFSHNWKQKLLLWHKNAISKVKKFKDKSLGSDKTSIRNEIIEEEIAE